jgi:hypothetical protein
MYRYMHTYTYMYICLCICMSMSMSMYMYTYMYMYMYICVCMYVCLSVCMYVCIYICTWLMIIIMMIIIMIIIIIIIGIIITAILISSYDYYHYMQNTVGSVQHIRKESQRHVLYYYSQMYLHCMRYKVFDDDNFPAKHSCREPWSKLEPRSSFPFQFGHWCTVMCGCHDKGRGFLQSWGTQVIIQIIEVTLNRKRTGFGLPKFWETLAYADFCLQHVPVC